MGREHSLWVVRTTSTHGEIVRHNTCLPRRRACVCVSAYLDDKHAMSVGVVVMRESESQNTNQVLYNHIDRGLTYYGSASQYEEVEPITTVLLLISSRSSLERI